MTDILLNYGIFLLELLTVLGVVALIVLLLISNKTPKSKGKITLTDLSEKHSEEAKALQHFFLSEQELKVQEKAEKKTEKAKAKAEKARLKAEAEKSTETESEAPTAENAEANATAQAENSDKTEEPARLFVLHFDGDIQASAVSALREEINAVLRVARAQDEVLLCLESPGGVVHGYGLAASQLDRLKQKGLRLSVAVDKVAASGGYMMACVADRIIAAPFAVIGSIGVVAQVPNIHRLLKRFDVDVDVMTAGEYKRTVTLLGENSEKGKQKFQAELEETHALFKTFVQQHRPQLSVEKVATGEHWFGQQALELGLVDEIRTSDDVILAACAEKQVIEVKFDQKVSLSEKMAQRFELSASRVLNKLLSKTLSPKL